MQVVHASFLVVTIYGTPADAFAWQLVALNEKPQPLTQPGLTMKLSGFGFVGTVQQLRLDLFRQKRGIGVVAEHGRVALRHGFHQ